LLNSTNGAIEMLSNLLHWSTSQMQGPHVNLNEINLSTALHSTLEIEKIYAHKKNITLEYSIPHFIQVMVDVDMLQLVIRNIISNAIKFTSSGGHIQVSAEVTAENCMITIADN